MRLGGLNNNLVRLIATAPCPLSRPLHYLTKQSKQLTMSPPHDMRGVIVFHRFLPKFYHPVLVCPPFHVIVVIECLFAPH